MTYEQYWCGDPLMVRAYYVANQLRQKQKDQESWLLGTYFRSALDSTVGNMFRKKGTQQAEYPKYPFSYLEDEAIKQRIKEKEAGKERLRLVAYLDRVTEQMKRQEQNH